MRPALTVVKIKERDYRVYVYPEGSVEIYGTRRVIVPATVFWACPVWNEVSVPVSANGRLGRLVLAAKAKQEAAA